VPHLSSPASLRLQVVNLEILDMGKLPEIVCGSQLHPSFKDDILNKHFIYDYAAKGEDGKPEKWRYELWAFSEDRIVYAIHGGPMAGRTNYQTCSWQCIRPGELWQCNWLEETGTVVSVVMDFQGGDHGLGKVTSVLAFSKGHWEQPKDALGDKRNKDDFERWRGLSKVGNNAERFVLSEQGDVVEKFEGKGDLVPISQDDPTM
jgi:hypothetical protein